MSDKFLPLNNLNSQPGGVPSQRYIDNGDGTFSPQVAIMGGSSGGGSGGGEAMTRQYSRVAYDSSGPLTVTALEPTSVVSDVGDLTDGSKVVMPDGVTWAQCAVSATVFMAENDDALAHPLIIRVFEADSPGLDGDHTVIVLNSTLVYIHGSSVYFRGPPFQPTPGMNYYFMVGSLTPVLISNAAIDTEILA